MKFSISALKQVQPILSFKNKLSKVNVNSFLHPQEKVVFVMGATGSGKSRLTIDLATRFRGEIIHSDKIQLYKGLDVLTNKVTPQECQGMPHHLLGVFDTEAGTLMPNEFSRLASQAISKVAANHKVPIVADGSNSYIEALANHSSLLNNYQCCFIWVDVSLPVLNSFVSRRVDRMMEAGLLKVVRVVFDLKADYSVAIRRAIGVPELDEYLRCESLVDKDTQKKMLDVAVKNIKDNTEKLACRQLKKSQRLLQAVQIVHGQKRFKQFTVKKIMPKLHHSEYFTEPQIQELAATEKVNPRYCKRVRDFVVGRHGYGSIKFLGEKDMFVNSTWKHW